MYLFSVAPALKRSAFLHPPAWAVAVAKSDPVRWCGVFPVTDGFQDCARGVVEDGLLLSMYAPMPLTVLFGGLLLVVVHFGLGLIIVRTSSPLSDALARGLQTLRDAPGLLVMPAVSMTAVAGLLTCVGSAAFARGASGGPGDHSIVEQAWRVVLSPPALAGYFGVVVILMLCNAVLIHSFLHDGDPRPPSALGSALAVLRIVPFVAALSLAVFGALLGFSLFLRELRRRLPIIPSSFVDFMGYFVESGVLIASQMVVAAMLAEGVGLGEAIRRAVGMVKPRGREILTVAFGMATMRHEACVAALIGPIGASFLFMPLLGDYTPIVGNDPGKLIAFGFFVGVFCTSAYFALMMAVEGVLAAGIYVYGRDGRVLPGLKAEHLESFLKGRETVDL